ALEEPASRPGGRSGRRATDQLRRPIELVDGDQGGQRSVCRNSEELLERRPVKLAGVPSDQRRTVRELCRQASLVDEPGDACQNRQRPVWGQLKRGLVAQEGRSVEGSTGSREQARRLKSRLASS